MHNCEYPRTCRIMPCDQRLLELELEQSHRQSIAEQIAEDTCSAHGIFCCDQCFDMTPISETCDMTVAEARSLGLDV